MMRSGSTLQGATEFATMTDRPANPAFGSLAGSGTHAVLRRTTCHRVQTHRRVACKSFLENGNRISTLPNRGCSNSTAIRWWLHSPIPPDDEPYRMSVPASK
jgi:hypothetical protein